FLKLRNKIALIAKKKLGINSIYILSHAPEKIYKTALELNADLYISHVECGLYVGEKLIKAGKKVAFDIEDWYSRDYLNDTRPVILLKKLEAFALNQGVYCTCPSYAMAKA